MRVAVGADHGGFALKDKLITRLRADYDIIDVGAGALDPNDDYPDFAVAVARKLLSHEAERGIIICGSGVGAAIAANKIPGIRAGVCHDTYSAHQGVEHDNMNVLSLGARVIGEELAFELVKAFLEAVYLDKGKYRRRVKKITGIEKEYTTTGRERGG